MTAAEPLTVPLDDDTVRIGSPPPTAVLGAMALAGGVHDWLVLGSIWVNPQAFESVQVLVCQPFDEQSDQVVHDQFSKQTMTFLTVTSIVKETV